MDRERLFKTSKKLKTLDSEQIKSVIKILIQEEHDILNEENGVINL